KAVPLLTVKTKKTSTETQPVSFKTKTKQDDEMYEGDSEVVQEGEDGSKNIRYLITSENGKQTDKHSVHQKVTEKARPKIVKKGTKVMPSRGSGELKRPVNGGHISSPMGQRWGHFHKGIDLAGTSGRLVNEAVKGEVVTKWLN